MPRKPKPDSWRYLSRDFPNNIKIIKQMVTWLEEHKPLFWLKDAERLAGYVRDRKHKPMTAADIPDTVAPELIPGLVERLQTINDWYNEQRRKRAERKRQIEEARGQIPQDERDALHKITGFAGDHYTKVNQHPTYEEFSDMRDLAFLNTLSKITQWLSMSPAERNLWIGRAERLLGTLQQMEEEARKEVEAKRQKEWDSQHVNWSQQQSFKYHYDNQYWDNIINDLLRQSNDNAYRVLGIAPGSPVDIIKKAYRSLAKQYHPDAGGNAEQFQKITEAYQELLAKAN